jgi:dUTP pyrophosphatase
MFEESPAHEHTEIRLEVQLIHPQAKLPFRKRETDAGYDLYAVQDATLKPLSITTIRTGLKMACPPGYYYTIDGRSSLWVKGVFPSRGIIDSTFTDEVIVSLVNIGSGEFEISAGDRIAQIILHKQYHANFKIVESFSPLYNQRGNAGFGSSGK